MIGGVPERWRFSLDNKDVSLRDLSWPEAVRVFRDTESGDLAAQADRDCVSLEFNATHAAVLYMGPDEVIKRPFFPHRPAECQDVAPFFCSGCCIQIGDKDEYLAHFMSCENGFRLFVAILSDSALPIELPDPYLGQSILPGFEEGMAEAAAARVIEWRPLRSAEANRK